MVQESQNSLNNKSINDMDLESLIKLINIAYELKAALRKGNEITTEEIHVDISLLAMLFEYMSVNLNSENIDIELLKFLEKLLGLNKKKKKKKFLSFEESEKEEEQELEHKEEQELELSREEKDRRYKLAIYEIYKVLNPHQLAGETSLENFINNVRTRGVVEAMKYEGAEHAQQFKEKDLENLESNRFSFIQSLAEHGAKGGGRGL